LVRAWMFIMVAYCIMDGRKVAELQSCRVAKFRGYTRDEDTDTEEHGEEKS